MRTQNIPRKSTIVESNLLLKTSKILDLPTQNTKKEKSKEKKKDFRKKQYSFNGGCQFALLCGGSDMVEAKLMQKRPGFKEIRVWQPKN